MGELQAASHLSQALVPLHTCFRPLQMLDDLGVDAAGDVEEGIRVVVKLGERGDAERVFRHQQRYLAAVGGADQMLGRGDVGNFLVLQDGHLHRTLGIHHIGDGKVAQARLREHQRSGA